ncbi:MAG: lipid A deacylase LpxR family protein [Gammaproteobacteria bacterium]|nr:lipid A deacylase LpxR family protein [Gammaproteobacteria bacterium]
MFGFAGHRPGARRRELHAIEFGMTAFTPEDVDTAEPILDDHPYGSLVFIANTRQRVLRDEGISYQSAFTLGVLGTDIPKNVQSFVHEALGQDVPQGWDNQISAGGEPTFRYTLNRQDTLALELFPGHPGHDIKTTFSGSVGYITEVAAGITGRWGIISTPWWSFTPDYAQYINLGAPVVAASRETGRNEFYLWGWFNRAIPNL